MTLDLTNLPQDPALLTQMLRDMVEMVEQQNAALQAIKTERDLHAAEIERLRLLIKQLQRMQFGRRSERLDPDQLQLALEDLEQAVAAAQAAQEDAAAQPGTGTAAVQPPPRRNRGALPAHLPRVQVLLDIAEKSCPCCGTLHEIGADVSEMLDVIPAQFRVKVIRRPRYGCRRCEGAVVQAPAPDRVLTDGLAAEALVRTRDGPLPRWRHKPTIRHCPSACRQAVPLASCDRPPITTVCWYSRHRSPDALVKPEPSGVTVPEWPDSGLYQLVARPVGAANACWAACRA